MYTSRDIIWSYKYKDSILDIVGTESGKIIVSLADGNISMMKVDKMLTGWVPATYAHLCTL